MVFLTMMEDTLQNLSSILLGSVSVTIAGTVLYMKKVRKSD